MKSQIPKCGKKKRIDAGSSASTHHHKKHKCCSRSSKKAVELEKNCSGMYPKTFSLTTSNKLHLGKEGKNWA